jgi:hypothetical protein
LFKCPQSGRYLPERNRGIDRLEEFRVGLAQLVAQLFNHGGLAELLERVDLLENLVAGLLQPMHGRARGLRRILPPQYRGSP